MKTKTLTRWLRIFRNESISNYPGHDFDRIEIVFHERSAVGDAGGYSFLNLPAWSEIPGQGQFVQAVRARNLLFAFCLFVSARWLL